MEKVNQFKEVKGSLVKASCVRDLVKDFGGRSTPDFIKEVEKQTFVIVKRSYERAKENGRNTVMRKDV